MKTLFDICEELQILEDHLLENPDADNTLIEEFLATAQGELNDKLDSYAAMISKLENRVSVRKQRAKELQELAKGDDALVNRLKSTLKWFFESKGTKKIETDNHRFTLANNGGKLPLILSENLIAEDLPDDLKIIETKPDVEAIRQRLNAGEVLPFAHYGERGSSIRIK